ncbi:MAG: MgtC/SapB family protein [Clostridia bacterium]|nr:MgtC/SapB family protein [Clostridia bacterium]
MTLFRYFLQQISLWQYLDFFARIIVACFCGAAIGFERSKRLKSAGLRTHIVVCCAAALMMIVSKYGFMDLGSASGTLLNGTRGADAARIAAQVVSGISFLGAGVIFKHGASVKGLTTAAGIWATAGIGLAIGAGMYIIGLFGMVVIVIIQYTMHKVKFGIEALSDCKLDFCIRDSGNYRSEFFKKIDEWHGQIEEISIENSGEKTRYSAVIKFPNNLSSEEIIRFFNENSDVVSFSVTPNL